MSDTAEKRYNGWTNYETWCVHLWLSNEEGSYNEARHLARQYATDYQRAQAFKEWVGEMVPDLGASMFADLLNGALSEVDWQEVADAFKDEDDEEDSDEDEEDV